MSTRIRMNFNLKPNQKKFTNSKSNSNTKYMIIMGYTKPRVCAKLRVVGNKNCTSCNSSKPKSAP